MPPARPDLIEDGFTLFQGLIRDAVQKTDRNIVRHTQNRLSHCDARIGQRHKLGAPVIRIRITMDQTLTLKNVQQPDKRLGFDQHGARQICLMDRRGQNPQIIERPPGCIGQIELTQIQINLPSPLRRQPDQPVTEPATEKPSVLIGIIALLHLFRHRWLFRSANLNTHTD